MRSFMFVGLSPGRSLLAGDVIGNGKRCATFGTAAGKDLAAIFRGHSLAESVLVYSATVRGLECSFHCL